MSERFTLEPRHWYGWSMYPGYGDAPYHSPIRVNALLPLGGRIFELSFLNLGYAAGVQNFKQRLRTLKRSTTHQICEDADNPQRSMILTNLTPGWMRTLHPSLKGGLNELFDAESRPVESSFLALAATSY